MKANLLCGAALFLFNSCDRLSPDEQKLIGTWAMPMTEVIEYHEGRSHTVSQTDEKAEITFTADRRELWSHGGGPPDSVARWHLEGGELVFTIISEPKDMNLPKQRRERIVRVTDTELVFDDGLEGARWIRVR